MTAVLTSAIRRARKTHWCFLCGYDIRAGARYHYSSGVYDGAWWALHAHLGCAQCVDDEDLYDPCDQSVRECCVREGVNSDAPRDVRAWRDGWPREVTEHRGAARVGYAVAIAARWTAAEASDR